MSVDLGPFVCHIAGMYAIYSSEIEVYQKIGLEEFWKHPDFDPFDPKRLPITQDAIKQTDFPH